MLGLHRTEVALCAHEAAWDRNARETAEGLLRAMHPIAVDVQHVGSTAIGSIRAKPIIDLVVGIADFGAFKARGDDWARAGLEHRPNNDRDDYMFFVLGDAARGFRTHHVHIVPYGGEEWNAMIDFRDYMNAHPEEARAYEALKASLAQGNEHDRGRYTQGKDAFVRDRIARATAWRREARSEGASGSAEREV